MNGWNDKAPSWNFCKFIIDEEGTVAAPFVRFQSNAPAPIILATGTYQFSGDVVTKDADHGTSVRGNGCASTSWLHTLRDRTVNSSC